MSASLLPVVSRKLPVAADFNLLELATPSGLCAQLLPTGAVYAFRHGETLLNQLLPGPAEDGLFRLLLRWRTHSGQRAWAPLVGPTVAFSRTGPASALWTTTTADGLACATILQLHPQLTAWAWRVSVRNISTTTRHLDVLHAQDLGLADAAAVRNNEAYISQYLDLLPVRDDALGWVILARQNQAMSGGCFPWLALACAHGAAEFCTDGTQFFGTDHRLTGEPAAVRLPALPSRRLQYEFALAGLQSRGCDLAPGAVTEFIFVARYLETHPAASGPSDLALLRDLMPASWIGADAVPSTEGTPAAPASVFLGSAWQHGDPPSEADWNVWFPGARRHEEHGPGGEIWSFFHGVETHVVSRSKETAMARPHGHILRSGAFHWIDPEQFGVTCYAAGIFGAQAYLGNSSFACLLSVVRNALNVARASGQRVFVRRDGDEWRQLGIPSAFVIQPGEVRWLYRLGADLVEARVWCGQELSASFLSLRVVTGQPCEFLVTHQLVVGACEFEHGGEAREFVEAGWIGLLPGPQSLMGQHQPEACFALAAVNLDTLSAIGGDGPLYPDEVERGGPYATVRSKAVRDFGVIMLGTHAGAASLPAAVAAARAGFVKSTIRARPPAAPLHGLTGADPGVARLNEVLPWFTHNAAIHFAAPHGLEQYGGAAWGVRDVCQGSLEWLLAAGNFDTVRRMLATVFAQQYAVEGTWPQWFMFPPFQFIQQNHSHGDVCFWPVKALCDYVEASNDRAFMQHRLGYTNGEHFTPTGPDEMLWMHCDRVVAHAETRFVRGTTLVNYGDGDWDDTLQPADPVMRTHMISAWTVALAFQTFHQLAALCVRMGETTRATRLDALLKRMRGDFHEHLMPGGVVAGFLVTEAGGTRPLLHPGDTVTGIRYRLLPMTRAVIAELFTPWEARGHLDLVASELRSPDGVRLMSEPVPYRGGLEHWFKRAETAANCGREIGLQYVHAHLRYAEALAKIGDAEDLWHALQVVNPVGLATVVPNAAPRQSNVYFSSSDADFADRYEAAARWSEIRRGSVPVRGGWRLYSSGPGLFLHKVRTCLLGVRESFGDVVFDPVLPRSLDGLIADTHLLGQQVRLVFSVKSGASGPSGIAVNGTPITEARREPNPYRTGGLRVAGAALSERLTGGPNRIEITL